MREERYKLRSEDLGGDFEVQTKSYDDYTMIAADIDEYDYALQRFRVEN